MRHLDLKAYYIRALDERASKDPFLHFGAFQRMKAPFMLTGDVSGEWGCLAPLVLFLQA